MKILSKTLSIPALRLLSASGSAQCLSQQFSSSPAPSTGDQFGRSLASDGDTLVVGASGVPRDGFVDVGSAFLYERTPSGYTQLAELTPSVSSNFHMFGESADIDGDWIVVGAPDGTGANTGAAYVFQKVGTNWIAGPRLVGSETDTGDRFGNSVGVVDGPTPRIVVGAHFNGIPGGFSTGGAVYVFEYDGVSWNEAQVLRSSDLLPGDFFGRSLAIDTNRLMVGASFNDAFANGGGAVYMFEHDGLQYNQTDQFAGSAAAGFNNFGEHMSMDGDWLAVMGAAIYVF